MTRLGRMVRALTLRRVLAALLIGAFADEIVAALSWLADSGWDLKDVAVLRGLAVAGLRFVAQGALIYLALRGVAAVLDRRRVHSRWTPGLEAGAEEHDLASGFEGCAETNTTRYRRPGKGGVDGHGPDEDH